MGMCTIAISGFLVVYYFQGVAAMAATEAQLRANKKYHSKFHRMQIRITEDEKQRVDEHTAVTGESVNAFVQRAIWETIERDIATRETNSERKK
jgi:predicted HicB family RNase H-like nuclease